MADHLTGPIQPSHRYGEFMHCHLHLKLERAANRLLAQAGFFPPGEAPEYEYEPVEAESIGLYGLRPTWHGKAA